MKNFHRHVQALSESYLNGLASANLEDILCLFSPKAEVQSPLYGKMPAATFYQNLFKDTQSSVVQLKDVLTNEQNLSACLFFAYTWTLASGAKVQFDVVDYLQLDQDGRIDFLQIVYDTRHSRHAYEALN